jgi:hypothetical protein
LQRCAKAGKRFVKIAPATYALLQQFERTDSTVLVQPVNEKTVGYGGTDEELEQVF